MALRSELAELLAGFEKRMKFINIVRYILDYKYPDHIRQMMPNRKVLDNVVVAVLVYIKDRTLGTEQTCSLSNVESFLEDLSVVLPNGSSINPKTLARYIVVDVLQRGGVMEEYETFYSTTEEFVPMSIRLINEEKGCYYLTDDGFDFLFRTKEIESELDYSVTRFKLKEYMKRDNYEGALDSSREMVSKIRNMKLSMDTFLLRCREDISKITIDYYESVVGRFRKLLEDEYQELIDIQSNAENRAKQLDEAIKNGIADEDTRRHKEALREISENIALTIDEQRALINKKSLLSQNYHMLLHDNFAVSHFQRLNFEQDILLPLRKTDDRLGDAAKFLLFMLTKPRLESWFSIESFYAPQGKLATKDDDDGIDITAETSDKALEIEQQNNLYVDIVQALFHFVDGRTRFRISDFIGSLRLSDLRAYCANKALLNVMLCLYELQTIDIENWKISEKFPIIPDGEFELLWCLEKIPENYLQVKQIHFSKSSSTFSFAVQQDGCENRFDITDFEVEVIR